MEKQDSLTDMLLNFDAMWQKNLPSNIAEKRNEEKYHKASDTQIENILQEEFYQKLIVGIQHCELDMLTANDKYNQQARFYHSLQKRVDLNKQRLRRHELVKPDTRSRNYTLWMQQENILTSCLASSHDRALTVKKSMDRYDFERKKSAERTGEVKELLVTARIYFGDANYDSL